MAKTSENPLFPGWYADPEARIFAGRYWIYPTYSAVYEKQTFFDAFYSEEYIVYHRRPLEETAANHRVVCIDRMEFRADGTIKPVQLTFEGVEGRKLPSPPEQA
ncbi:hypothetical protein [Paenibacillus oralis]|nr:hypothetical protein [Paenibacillus oralis]